MKIRWRNEAVSLLLLVAMFVAAGVTWSSAPDRIPAHWGASGEPDRYAGKFEGLLGPPLMALGIYILFLVLPRIDPRKENYARFQGVYTVLKTLMVAFMAGLLGIVVLWARGVQVDTGMAVMLMTGLLIMGIGNFLGKLRPTWFVGIKTPWTLSSEESWNKTHRLGGKLFVIWGLALAIAAPFHNTLAFSALFAGMLGLVVCLYAYSYLVWRRDPAAGPAKVIKRL